MQNFRRPVKPCMLMLGLFLIIVGGCAGLNVRERQQLDNLADQVSQTRGRVQKRVSESPDTSLSKSLKLLNEVLNYVDAVRSSSDRFDPQTIEKYNHRIAIINENIKRFRDLILKTDVSFPIGTYQISALSDQGRTACLQLADKIVAMVRDLKQRYPDHAICVTLKTIGYTDEIPVSSRSLRQMILNRLEGGAADAKDRDQLYNKVLSELRAETVNHFIVDYLRQKLPNHFNVQYVEQIMGKGERLPRKKIEPAYRSRDERRRICIISPYIEVLL